MLLIESFDLEHLTPAEIDDNAPLFDSNGIGLDSIDALEIGIILKKKYDLVVSGEDEGIRQYFRSVSTLAELITQHRKVATA